MAEAITHIISKLDVIKSLFGISRIIFVWMKLSGHPFIPLSNLECRGVSPYLQHLVEIRRTTTKE